MGTGPHRACRFAFLVLLAVASTGRGQDDETAGIVVAKSEKRITAQKPKEVLNPFFAPQAADFKIAKDKADEARKRKTITGGRDFGRETPPLRQRKEPPAHLIVPQAADIESAQPATPPLAANAVIKPIALPKSSTSTFLADELEPSVAITRRGETLYTGNIFATYSDGLAENGDPKPFQFIKVDELFELPSNCRARLPHFCDQVALYDGENGRDLMLWYLQYFPVDGASNTVRLIVANGKDSHLPPVSQWDFFDFKPSDINSSWASFWFDFPDLALGKDYLYISTNMFQFTGSGHAYRGAVVMRLRLAELTAPPQAGLSIEYIHSRISASLRPTLNARTGMMYLFGHNFVQGATELEVYSWSETAGHSAFTTPQRKIFGVRSFNRTQDGPPWSQGDPPRGYHSPCPDGGHWLNKADHRITAAWAADNKIGCAWSVNKDPSGDRKFPHVRSAILNLGTDQMPTAVAAEPSIWSPDFGYAYPAVGVSQSGKVGFAVASGGGTTPKGRMPSFSVGIFDLSQLPTKTPWIKQVEVIGEANSESGRWGDYGAVRPDYSRGRDAFIATGFAVKRVDDVMSLTPYLVRFGDGATTPIKDKDPPPADKLKEVQDKADQIKKDLDALIELIKKLKGPGTNTPDPGTVETPLPGTASLPRAADKTESKPADPKKGGAPKSSKM